MQRELIIVGGGSALLIGELGDLVIGVVFIKTGLTARQHLFGQPPAAVIGELCHALTVMTQPQPPHQPARATESHAVHRRCIVCEKILMIKKVVTHLYPEMSFSHSNSGLDLLGSCKYICMARFIPVCTGNTIMTCWLRFAVTVHPRVYGEHAWQIKSSTLNNGSSPCVRGTQSTSYQWQKRRRFIPVCTGNTRVYAIIVYVPPVHPRVYGEHPSDCDRGRNGSGSSPCVRGTRYG